MYSFLRRRQMMLAGGSPTPPGPAPGQYVQDGLILHLDGIDKGNTEGKWTSLVGGYEFTNYRAVFNENNVEFNVANSPYVENTDFVVPLATVGTIEICYETSVTAAIQRLFWPITTNGAGRFAVGFYYTSSTLKLIWSYNLSKPMYVPVPSKGTVSVNNVAAVSNGSAMTQSGSDYWTGTNLTNKIGHQFTGKIYSIRIYNRQLTKAEMTANQAVDNSRFGLGL